MCIILLFIVEFALYIYTVCISYFLFMLCTECFLRTHRCCNKIISQSGINKVILFYSVLTQVHCNSLPESLCKWCEDERFLFVVFFSIHSTPDMRSQVCLSQQRVQATTLMNTLSLCICSCPGVRHVYSEGSHLSLTLAWQSCFLLKSGHCVLTALISPEYMLLHPLELY